jgi:hypothetical protein
MLRRSPKGSRGWIQINPVYADPLPAADSGKLSGRCSGRWRPLGITHHVPADPVLMKLASFLGKRDLMGYLRLAASTDFAAARLWKRWASLSPAKQRVVTLWDLCHVCYVTRAEFVRAAVQGSVRAGHASVLVAMQSMNLPEDVELVIGRWFVSRRGSEGQGKSSSLGPVVSPV